MLPTSTRMVVLESVQGATTRSTPKKTAPLLTSPYAVTVAETAPPLVKAPTSNPPIKSKLKLNHSPTTSTIASSSKLPLRLAPVKFNKKADGGWLLRPSQVANYLGSTKAFPIFPPPVVVRVSRPALSEAYKLPGMGLLWVSKSKNNPLRVMMPTYEHNPEMPRAPGEPGILLSCREEMCKDGP